MASPKAPGPPMPPLTDPKSIEEVVADDMIVQIINGVAHFLFYAVRPRDLSTNGEVTNERIITARIAMSITAAGAMSDCIRQLQTAMQINEQPKKLN